MEKKVMKEFQENDKELENIALQIARDLNELGNKQNNVQRAIGEQYDQLVIANEEADKVEVGLRKQNNDLAKLLNKFRNGKQIWMDFILIFILMGFLALLWNRLKAKEYI